MKLFTMFAIAATLASVSAWADVEIECRDTGSSSYYLGANRIDSRISAANEGYKKQGYRTYGGLFCGVGSEFGTPRLSVLLANQTRHLLLRDTNQAFPVGLKLVIQGINADEIRAVTEPLVIQGYAPLLSGANGTLKAQVSSARVGFGDQVAIVLVPSEE